MKPGIPNIFLIQNRFGSCQEIIKTVWMQIVYTSLKPIFVKLETNCLGNYLKKGLICVYIYLSKKYFWNIYAMAKNTASIFMVCHIWC